MLLKCALVFSEMCGPTMSMPNASQESPGFFPQVFGLGSEISVSASDAIGPLEAVSAALGSLCFLTSAANAPLGYGTSKNLLKICKP